MTELETKIWNTVHNWCDAQSNEIPDQNRRYLMDEIKALVSSNVAEQIESYSCKYVRRVGESCTLNNNCKYPNCE